MEGQRGRGEIGDGGSVPGFPRFRFVSVTRDPVPVVVAKPLSKSDVEGSSEVAPYL